MPLKTNRERQNQPETRWPSTANRRSLRLRRKTFMRP